MSIFMMKWIRPCLFSSRGPVFAAVLVACFAGCRQPDDRLRDEDQARRDHLRSSHRSLIGKSVEARPIECLTYGDGPDTVLILATIHGNESAGTPLLERLAVHFDAHPDLVAGRRILLVPVTNPDGFSKRVRHNHSGVDLNRNFPASNWNSSERHGDSALSEPESVALHNLIESARPNRIVSLHEPYGCIDYDGPAEGLARAMAAQCDLPVRKLGGRPGSLGSYAGETLKIPIVTVEFPESVARWDGAAMWDRYGKMLLAAITYPESPTR